MKKVESIEIQGRLFPIQPTAYKALEKYLQTIRHHFSKYDDTFEVVSDIESRIAEKFADEILTPQHDSITVADVRAIMKEIGSVEDITDLPIDEDVVESEEASSVKKANAPSKQLFRDQDRAVIAGVASGIAAYLNIDPLIVRALFIIIFFMGGLGGYSFVIYLLLWVLVPKAVTPSEKLQMRGDSVTLSKMEQTIKEGLDRAPTQANKIIKQIDHSISPFKETLISLFQLGLRIGGGLMILSSVAALFGLLFGLIIVFFNLNHPYIDPAIYEIASVMQGAWLPTLFTSIFVLAGVPLFIKLLLGVSFFKLRSVFSIKLLIPLLAIWLCAIGTITTLAITFAPAIQSKTDAIIAKRQSEYSQQVVEKSYEFSDFTDITVKDHTRVVLHSGPFAVKASGDTLGVERVQISQDGTSLTLGNVRNGSDTALTQYPCWIGCPHMEVTVDIWLPELNSLTIADIGNVETEGLLSSEKTITINLKDASHLDGIFNTPELLLTQTDIARGTFAGQIETAVINLKDSTSADFTEAQMSTVSATTRDIARLSLPEVGTLDVDAQDVSRVEQPGGVEYGEMGR